MGIFANIMFAQCHFLFIEVLACLFSATNEGFEFPRDKLCLHSKENGKQMKSNHNLEVSDKWGPETINQAYHYTP